MNSLPFDIVSIIYHQLDLVDLMHVKKTCRCFKTAVEKFVHLNPVCSKMISLVKNLDELKEKAHYYIKTKYSDYKSSKSECEHLVYNALEDSKSMNTSGQWVVLRDVQTCVSDITLWVKNEFETSKLSIIKEQIVAEINAEYSKPEKRVELAIKLGTSVPFQITKAVMKEKRAQIESKCETATKSFKSNHDYDLKEVLDWCLRSMYFKLLALGSVILDLIEKYRSRYIYRLTKDWILGFPELTSRWKAITLEANNLK